jgi:hypothetical protein
VDRAAVRTAVLAGTSILSLADGQRHPDGMPLFCLDSCKTRCYAAEMAVPVARKITRWIFDHLLWDTAGTAREGFWRALWATRKLLVAVVGAALLTWWEWIEHHPPAIAIVALIHLVFVLVVIGLLVYIGQRFSNKKSPSG